MPTEPAPVDYPPPDLPLEGVDVGASEAIRFAGCRWQQEQDEIEIKQLLEANK